MSNLGHQYGFATVTCKSLTKFTIRNSSQKVNLTDYSFRSIVDYCDHISMALLMITFLCITGNAGMTYDHRIALIIVNGH